MEERKASKRCGGVLPFFIGFLLTCIIGWAIVPPLFYKDVEQPVRFSHQVHVEEQGMDCESCHYFREDGTYAGFPTNEQCAECHAVDEPEAVMDVIVEQVGEDYTAVLDLSEEEMPEDLTYLLMSESDANRKAELEYLVKYLIPGKDVPWLNYQYQPDNVYFSHMAHQNLSIDELKKAHLDLDDVTVAKIGDLDEDAQNCSLCHMPGIATNDTPPPFERNIISGYSKMTMKMWQCERCHAQMGQDNACYVCHK